MECWGRGAPKAVKILPLDDEDEEMDVFMEQKMLAAVESGDVGDFQKFYLQNTSFINYRGEDGKTLLHVAASKDKINMIKLLIRCGIDLDIQDDDGSTALHDAVEAEALESIEYLIVRGADSSILNYAQLGIIHLAVEHKKFNALGLLVRLPDKVDLLLGGEHGRTALHLAAFENCWQSAEIILGIRQNKVLTHPCEHGITPIHSAARNASCRTLKILLSYGETMGMSRSEMMCIRDEDGNSPIHAAVHSGEIDGVRFCMENGARISQQESHLSTPVHMAASQGSLHLLKLMFEMQPEEKDLTLAMQDLQGMTPLHYAAMFNHMEITSLLISEGADPNVLDSAARTPILLAAERACWTTVQTLMELKVDLTVTNNDDCNILHLIITHGGSVEDFVQQIQKVNRDSVDHLLNDRDCYGCTPLHYVSRIGKHKSAETLILLGAKVNIKNNEKESPLHFASRFGRYFTVLTLLQGDKGLAIINEVDGKGMTPLHIASLHGHIRIVQQLLNRGALLTRDHKGRNPLHLAALHGFVNTMSTLLAIHSQLLDQKDKHNDTPLHLAAMANKANAVTLLLKRNAIFSRNSRGYTPLDIALNRKHVDAARALVTTTARAREMLKLDSTKNDKAISNLIASMPDVFQLVLDSCFTCSDAKEDSVEYSETYSFEYLQHNPETIQQLKKETKDYKPNPLPALNIMVHYRRLNLLYHPVSLKYLEMKWNAYGMYVHVLNVSLYIIFMSLLTTLASFLILEFNRPAPAGEDESKFTGNSSSTMYYLALDLSELTLPGHVVSNACTMIRQHKTSYIAAATILFFSFVNGFKELVQFYQQGFKYLLDPVNYMEWILYLSSTMLAMPIFDCNAVLLRLETASIAIFVAWFNFLLYLQRFERTGIYVVMFLEILKTLIKALVIFSILLVAFGLAFHILLSKMNIGFNNVPISFIRVFSMMLGEFDLMGTFLGIEDGDHKGTDNNQVPALAMCFLIMFMILMPILLINLLIGMAVGDIEGVRRNALLKRVSMQVEMHSELERKIPQFILDRVDRQTITIFPNAISETRFKIIKPLLQKIWNVFHETFHGSNSQETTGGPSAIELQIYSEITKQKQRLKTIDILVEKLHTMMKQVVAKMDIRNEADDFDEGIHHTHTNHSQTRKNKRKLGNRGVGNLYGSTNSTPTPSPTPTIMASANHNKRK